MGEINQVDRRVWKNYRHSLALKQTVNIIDLNNK